MQRVHANLHPPHPPSAAKSPEEAPPLVPRRLCSHLNQLSNYFHINTAVVGFFLDEIFTQLEIIGTKIPVPESLMLKIHFLLVIIEVWFFCVALLDLRNPWDKLAINPMVRSMDFNPETLYRNLSDFTILLNSQKVFNTQKLNKKKHTLQQSM